MCKGDDDITGNDVNAVYVPPYPPKSLVALYNVKRSFCCFLEARRREATRPKCNMLW